MIDLFVKDTTSTVYEEPQTDSHDQIAGAVSVKVMSQVLSALLAPGIHVYEIGCGTAPFLRALKTQYQIDDNKVTFIRKYASDITDVQVPDDVMFWRSDIHDHRNIWSKDFKPHLIVARHVLEHSPIPLYVLTLLRQVVNPTGFLYIEVPAPDTPSSHEFNPNHYSVFGRRAWSSLFIKAKLKEVDTMDISFKTAGGYMDKYYGFLLTPILN